MPKKKNVPLKKQLEVGAKRKGMTVEEYKKWLLTRHRQSKAPGVAGKKRKK